VLRPAKASVVLASAAVAVAAVVARPAAAGADAGSAGAWEQQNNNTVTVEASVPGSPAQPSPGAPGTPGSPGGGEGGSASPNTCASAPVDGIAPPPGAGPGQWVLTICSPNDNLNINALGGESWNITWQPSSTIPPPPPPPDPGQVAAEAESELTPPSPVVDDNPTGTGYVNLAEWFWVDPSVWHPISATATACNAGGCVTATATATPVEADWSFGDGATLACMGPGTPYDLTAPPGSQSTYCSHLYSRSSLGEPSPDGNPNDAAFPVETTVTWQVTWTASGAAGGSGTLAPLHTTGSTTLRVEQIESVISG
jgi:hypothetical protein